jgi:hypothetical protein
LNLWYRPDDGGRWVFGMFHPDATDKWADSAWSSARAQTGVWTHLTATYDAPANRIRLYVDGELSATQLRKAARFDATGPLRVGRTMWDSNPGLDYFGGAIDEVKVYDRLLSDTEIRAAVSRDNVQVGHWQLDEKSGTTATASRSRPGPGSTSRAASRPSCPRTAAGSARSRCGSTPPVAGAS